MNNFSVTGSLATTARDIRAHYIANTGLWLMFTGLAVMFLPTLWDLIVKTGLWLDDEHAHGPLILSISLWLLWKRWHNAPDLASLKPAPVLAWVCLLVAAACISPAGHSISSTSRQAPLSGQWQVSS